MVEIKMSSSDQTKTEVKQVVVTTMPAPSDEHGMTNMESVNRIAKLPVVESTINAAHSLYEKAKDSNSMINWGLTTAESTVQMGVEKITPFAKPVASRLEGSIKKVDDLLCSGIDYVEHKVPCVKLPASEMLENTQNYINNTVTPAVQTAKIVCQPAVQAAVAVKDYGVQKVEEYMSGKKQETTTSDGRPRRLRPALLPSSFCSLVYMYVNLEDLLQQQEQHMSEIEQSDELPNNDKACARHAK